jgi:hypothetical protein
MGLTFHERIESRKGEDGEAPWRELVYDLRGTSSDTLARSTAATSTPATYDELPRQTIDVDPVWVDSVTGNGHWTVTVRYGRSSPRETGDSAISFRIGSTSQHVTQSLSRIAKYPAGAPDCKGAINVTSDAVEGVDIDLPAYEWSETHYIAAASVTAQYRATLAAIKAAPINSGTFRGFAAGEVKFLGATGSKRGDADWEITFDFIQSPNVTGRTIGGITGIAKTGWQYLWVLYKDAVDTGAAPPKLVKVPAAVYIEQVYASSDFAGLGIGTD